MSARRAPLRFRSYLRGRWSELATATTRAVSEPQADWALRKVRLDGRPFRFEGHTYLRAIYDDTAQHIVLSKAAQIGGTTWAVLKALHACVMGLNVMYFFPTRTDVLEFSKSRVTPLLQDNPFLRRLMRDTDTAGLKRIGDAYLYLRGMQSTVGMKSVPADMVVFDELDEATPEAKAMARERLAHSDFKRLVELSNPSLPGFGIDEAFQLSDQRHWTLRCERCGEWTSPDKAFPDSLGQEVRIIGEREDGAHCLTCPKCRSELNIEEGEWVADFPGRETHGYCISQLFSSKVDPGEILREYRSTRFPERFFNLKIGIAWADTQNRLTVSEVLQRCGDEAMKQYSDGPCTMGVDTGRELHVVIAQRTDEDEEERRIVHLGVHHDFAELDDLMDQFNVSRCVIDALPEIHATREFARRHEGRVYQNYFNEHQRGSVAWKPDSFVVQENRTEALDLSRATIRKGIVLLPRRGRLVEELAQHMASDVKRLEEDADTGSKSYRYVRTAADHFSLAFTYECLAAEYEWNNQIRGTVI